MISRTLLAGLCGLLVLGTAVADEPKPTPYQPNGQTINFTDGAGGVWDIHNQMGLVRYGSDRRTFNGNSNQLVINGQYFYNVLQQAMYLAQQGRGPAVHHRLGKTGLLFGPCKHPSLALMMTRRIERLATGWMRFTTTYRNTSGAPLSVQPYIQHGFNTTSGQPKQVAVGDSEDEPLIAYLMPQTSGRRGLLTILGAGKRLPISVRRNSSRYVQVHYGQVTIPAEKELSVVTFMLQLPSGGSPDKWLKAFSLETALEGMSEKRLQSVKNFPSAGALPGLVIPRSAAADLVVLDDGRQLKGKANVEKLSVVGAAGKHELTRAELWGLARSKLPGQFRVGKVDGRIMVGRVSPPHVSLALMGGQTLEIPWGRVKSLAFQTTSKPPKPVAGALFAILRPGDRMTVTALEKPLEVLTRLGKLQVTREDLKRLQVVTGGNWGHRVELANGTRMGCLLTADQVHLTLAGGEKVSYPLRLLHELRTARRSKARAAEGALQMDLRNGDRLVCKATSAHLDLVSEFGKVRLKWEQVKELTVSGISLRAQVSLFDGNILHGHLVAQVVGVTLSGAELAVPTDLLGSVTQPNPGVPGGVKKRLSTLVAELDAKSFKTREAAEAALIELGRVILPALESQLAGGKLSAEQKTRIERVVERLKKSAGK